MRDCVTISLGDDGGCILRAFSHGIAGVIKFLKYRTGSGYTGSRIGYVANSARVDLRLS